MEEKIFFQKTLYLYDNMILDNGQISKTLNEETIKISQNIKFVIHSNEMTGHNRPHIHAYFNNKEYVITIDDSIELLHPAKEDKYFKLIKNNYLIENLQIARMIWNTIYSNYKFKVDKDGKYMC